MVSELTPFLVFLSPITHIYLPLFLVFERAFLLSTLNNLVCVCVHCSWHGNDATTVTVSSTGIICLLVPNDMWIISYMLQFIGQESRLVFEHHAQLCDMLWRVQWYAINCWVLCFFNPSLHWIFYEGYIRLSHYVQWSDEHWIVYYPSWFVKELTWYVASYFLEHYVHWCDFQMVLNVEFLLSYIEAICIKGATI